MANVSLQKLHQIVVDAAAAHTVEDQVESLVANVRDALGVGVCSLYRSFDGETLRLVANRGFAPEVVNRIVLPMGEGLVGRIAQDRMPLNLPVAREHPDFRHFPDSGEDAYPSFLGVPIVYLGEVNGVLVVQDVREREFSDDEQSFLVTIAAQLGSILLRLPAADQVGSQRGGQRNIAGIVAAPGKAIGDLRLMVSDETLKLVDEPVAGTVVEELARLAEAAQRAGEDIDRAKDQLSVGAAGDVLEVFDFYKALLTGDQLLHSAERRVREGASAFAAVRDSVDEYALMFDAIEDDYLRARGEDIRHIGNKLLAAILGAAAPAHAAGRVVLLGEMVSIADIGAYRPEQIAGIVCMQGSSLSHTAVLARSLGIPAVVGTGSIDHIHDGMQAIVDGDEGVVVFTPSASMLSAYQDMIAADRAFEQELLAQKDLPAVTRDGVRIALYANTGLLSDARPGKARGAEGIGLYRSEIPFLASTTLPTEAEQYAIYRELLEIYHPLPVTMRTLDIGGDKQLPYLPILEDNPTLGWRGIRFALDNPAILATQLRAMVRADLGLSNLSIMLPMVGNVDEVVAVRRVLDGVIERLAEEGIEAASPPLGIMIEIPGVVAVLSHLAGVADFLSIGTNDLTQYLLAVDRGNPHVATRYDHLHPAVLRMIADIVRFGRRANLPVSVCGEMAGDPAAAIVLVGLGIERLSMSAFALPRIKALIRNLSREAAARVAKRALGKRDPAAIRATVARAVRDWDLERVVERRTSP